MSHFRLTALSWLPGDCVLRGPHDRRHAIAQSPQPTGHRYTANPRPRRRHGNSPRWRASLTSLKPRSRHDDPEKNGMPCQAMRETPKWTS